MTAEDVRQLMCAWQDGYEPFDQDTDWTWCDEIAKRFQTAVLAEREACALIAENTTIDRRLGPKTTIAIAIRARSAS